jgi:hypothetical protein
MMTRFRFRIGTIMFAVAALALILGVATVFKWSGFSGARIEIFNGQPFLLVWPPEKSLEHHTASHIPLQDILYPLALTLAFFYMRWHRKRRVQRSEFKQLLVKLTGKRGARGGVG